MKRIKWLTFLCIMVFAIACGSHHHHKKHKKLKPGKPIPCPLKDC